jgi:hypothetical protein
MDEAALAARFDELCRAVLAPLVLGGEVHPVRPIGADLGLLLGKGRLVDDVELASSISVARVRRARLIAPVDALPDLDQASFAQLAALNDLIQLTNHHLAGPLTRGRYARLAANVGKLCERIPAPRDVLEALSRHATFARALEVARTDSAVAWWTGSARFRGEPPPSRLLAWPELRRVHVDARKVPLADMPAGAHGVPPGDYAELLGLWLTRSPLTDIATAARKAPPFAWSASTLSLIAAGPGRMLALRALASEPAGAVNAALTRAAGQVPPAYEEARGLAEGFAGQVKERFELLAEEAKGAGRPAAGGA